MSLESESGAMIHASGPLDFSLRGVIRQFERGWGLISQQQALLTSSWDFGCFFSNLVSLDVLDRAAAVAPSNLVPCSTFDG